MAGQPRPAGLNYQGHIAPIRRTVVYTRYLQQPRAQSDAIRNHHNVRGHGVRRLLRRWRTGERCDLQGPQGVAADGNGNVYIADTGNGVIRKVDSSGTITTFLTTLTASNGFAVSAAAYGMNVDGSGNLYAADGLRGLEDHPFGFDLDRCQHACMTSATTVTECRRRKHGFTCRAVLPWMARGMFTLRIGSIRASARSTPRGTSRP